jgi:transcriptional regulator with XRE-family HTH domain
MKSPITGKEMKRMRKEDVLEVRKESYPILYHYYLCEDTGEEFTDVDLEDLNLAQAYNQYRTRNNLPFPDEIKALRDQYGLSAARMSEILGFGANVYRHYEAGDLPNVSNARLIQAAQDPREFKKLLRRSNAPEGNSLEKLIKRIDQLIQDQSDFRHAELPRYLMTGLIDVETNIYTGYRTPSLPRLIEMIVYFTETSKPLKTKMNRLLFYADFLHFKQKGFSISGAEYKALEMGPVPMNFDSIFEHAAMKDEIEITYQEFSNGSIGQTFSRKGNRVFNASLFEPDELAAMQKVAKQFKQKSIGEMIKLTHSELAWSENKSTRSKISYGYAFKLKHI